MKKQENRFVQIPVGEATLEGELKVPDGATGLVLFTRGGGRSQHSPRHKFVARKIREGGLGTLLFSLLTVEEEASDPQTHQLRFNIGLLSKRLMETTSWLRQQQESKDLRFGYYGSSIGAGAALVAAARIGSEIGANVLRGGRPDLADTYLPSVKSATLLIVGSLDEPVISLHERAYAKLRCEKEIRIIPGASHRFEEFETLREVARLATRWFRNYLRPRSIAAGGGA